MKPMTPTTGDSRHRWLAGLLLAPLVCAALPTPVFALRAAGLEENSSKDEMRELLRQPATHPAHSGVATNAAPSDEGAAWAAAGAVFGVPAVQASHQVAGALQNLLSDLVVSKGGPYEAKAGPLTVTIHASISHPAIATRDFTFSVHQQGQIPAFLAGLPVELLDADGQLLRRVSLDQSGQARFPYVAPASTTPANIFGRYRFQIRSTAGTVPGIKGTESATGLEEANAVTALETLQRTAAAARINAPAGRFYFLSGAASVLAPAFQRLGIDFLVRVESAREAKAFLDLGVPKERIAGATNEQMPSDAYRTLGIARTAFDVWSGMQFLGFVHRPEDPWQAESAILVTTVPGNDQAWGILWPDWLLPDVVRAQLTSAVQATEDYFRTQG